MQVGGRTLEVCIFLPLGHTCSTPFSPLGVKRDLQRCKSYNLIDDNHVPA